MKMVRLSGPLVCVVSIGSSSYLPFSHAIHPPETKTFLSKNARSKIALPDFATKQVFNDDKNLVVPKGKELPSNLHTRGGAFWKKVPNTAFDRTLRLESYCGLAYSVVAAIYVAFAAGRGAFSDGQGGTIIGMLGTLLTFSFFGFHANDGGDTPKSVMLITRFVLSALLLYQTEIIDGGTASAFAVPFRLVTLAMAVGVISPCLSAISISLSAIYLYKLGCDHVLSPSASSALLWMASWSGITLLTSFGWLSLFYDDYDDDQKARVLRTHWQDKILAVFALVVSGGLDRAGLLTATTVGAPIVYLLAPVTIWFTLETKLLNHLKVGTPFHPSWWVDGSVPKFHPSDKVNASFGIATALITVVLTSYAFYAVMKAVSFSSLSFAMSAPSIWKFLLAHGILFVFHSGIWMIVASSGVPPIGNAPCFRIFPPELPPLIRANPHDCIPMHKFDLAIGTFLLALGAFAKQDGGNEMLGMGLKGLVGVSWLYSFFTKIQIHKDGWGYVAPVEG